MSIESLREEILASDHPSPEYSAKMLHKVPEATVVNREHFILEYCKDKVVLNLGSTSGSLHGKIQEIAKGVIGVDREKGEYDRCQQFDLDGILPILPCPTDLGHYDIIIAGEILEHLTNPGNFLRWIKTFNIPAILTTPNTFSDAGRYHMRQGIENVNKDHVAWYSYHTLKSLIEKCGFLVKEWYWYNGKPLTAEGLIFVIR